MDYSLPPPVRDPAQNTPRKEKERNAADSEGFTVVRNKKRERRSPTSQAISSPEMDSDAKRNRNDSYNGTSEERSSAGERGEQQQREDSPGRKETAPSQSSQPNDTHRLLFPSDCKFTMQEKVLWTVKLAREHRTFSALLKDGRSRPYITVKTQEAADYLINEGYDGLKLVAPERGEKTTKIIIFRYPEYLDVDYVLDDQRIVWAKRNKLRGADRCQVIALIKGDAPRRLFVNGLGFRPVAQYIEEPRMCLRCSRWGHDAWTCQSDPRCRFCGRSHISTVCGDKIRQQTRVTPRCANCRGEHNARHPACPAHPLARMTQRGRPAPPLQADQATRCQGRTLPAPPPAVNAWGQGRPQLPGEERPVTAAIGTEDTASGASKLTTAITSATEGGGAAEPGALDPAPKPGAADLAPTTDTATPAPTGPAEDGKCSCVAAQESSALFALVTELCKKIESLENKVKVLERPRANKSDNKVEKKPEAQRKVMISGKEKVFKPLMLNGLEAVEKALKMCGDDESKKNKVFKGWVEAHKVVDKIMSEMENIASSPQDSNGLREAGTEERKRGGEGGENEGI